MYLCTQISYKCVHTCVRTYILCSTHPIVRNLWRASEIINKLPAQSSEKLDVSVSSPEIASKSTLIAFVFGECGCMYMYVCVRECVCGREKERDRKREIERER